MTENGEIFIDEPKAKTVRSGEPFRKEGGKKKDPVMTREPGRVDESGDGFFDSVASLIEQARKYVGRTADLTMCVMYFEIGRMIIEEEQGGEARAKYGHNLLAELSRFLEKRFGKGFSETNLRNVRKFYLIYSPSIRQSMITVSGNTSKDKSNNGLKNQIQQTMFAEFIDTVHSIKSQTLLGEFKNERKNQNGPIAPGSYPFKLSWSHYLILMRIKNDQERRFYEIEAVNGQWTFRHLQRQYGSSLYERLALSRNKEEIMRLANEGQTIEKPRDILKDPVVLEGLGLKESAEYSETDLESAIISKLSQFLLELGKGFLFESRQKRFTFDEDHFFVDLVFYNRLLRCYVLIDLKTEKLRHQDLGQMQMYVNYFDRYVRKEDERPTIGILLCREKNDSVVELTLPEESNIYASEYSLYLPDKTILQQKLSEWTEEFEEEHNWSK